MREKELKLIITFESTTKAMEMEKMCKEMNVPGRLIPIPRSISAGCGMVWCMNLEDSVHLESVRDKAGITENRIIECMV